MLIPDDYSGDPRCSDRILQKQILDFPHENYKRSWWEFLIADFKGDIRHSRQKFQTFSRRFETFLTRLPDVPNLDSRYQMLLKLFPDVHFGDLRYSWRRFPTMEITTDLDGNFWLSRKRFSVPGGDFKCSLRWFKTLPMRIWDVPDRVRWRLIDWCILWVTFSQMLNLPLEDGDSKQVRFD